MSFPYKNPISPNQLLGQQSLERTKTYGTNYSVLSTGGYMEVYSLDQLYYTIPPSTFGPIEFSGNSIPITFSKGSGTTFSVDTLTLHPDNISSGRRKQGMLVYVKEVDQVYQYSINHYETLWNNATGSTGTTIVSDFGTTIRANSPENITFINSWTANTIDGVSGVTRANAVWKKYHGTNLAITGGSYNSISGTLTLTNITGGTQNITGFSTGGGGGGGDTITGGTFDKNTETLTLSSSGGSIFITGFTDVYTTGGTYDNGAKTLELYDNSGNTILITGFTSPSSGTSVGAYGSFSLNTNLPVSGANIETVWTYDTDEISNGIYISGGSKIRVVQYGIYSIGYSAQIEKTQGGSATDVTIWAKINGTPVDRSSSTTTLVSNSAYILPFVSYIFELYPDDYVEFYFSAPSQYVQLTSLSGLTSPTRPNSPSLIVVAQSILGTVATFTGNTSATCINDIYVQNLHGCSPINIWSDLRFQTGFTLTSIDNLVYVYFDNFGTGEFKAEWYDGFVNSLVKASGDTLSLETNNFTTSEFGNLLVSPNSTDILFNTNTSLSIDSSTGSTTTSFELRGEGEIFLNANYNLSGNTSIVLKDNLIEINAPMTQFSALTVNGELNTDYIQFDTTFTATTTEGKMWWNQTDGTLNLGMKGGNVTQQIGLEQYYIVSNISGVTIPEGYVVRAAGTDTINERIVGDLMIANGTIPPNFTLGIATETITSGNTGYITSFGVVRGINATGSLFGETWNIGNILYVSPTTPGGLTNVMPNTPDVIIEMAFVLDNSVNGAIFVRPTIFGRLEDLIDVQTTGATQGDLLVYNSSNNLWEHSTTLTASYNITGTSSASTFNITSVPITNTTESSVLVRNSTSGNVEIRSINSLINTNNTITVALTGSTGVDFNSIKAAVDSITGASSANTYTVEVAGGVYYENPFTIPSWVAVVGESSISTVIEAIDPSQTLINLSDQSAVFDCQIQGCTGTNVSAIVYSSSTIPQALAISYVENVRFGSNYTHAKVVAFGGANIIMQCSNVKYGGYPFTIGFYATNSGSGVGRMQLRNVTSTNGGIVTTPGLVFAKADAQSCGFIVNGCLLTKAAGAAAGTGFYVENGGFLRLTAVNFQRWAVGIDAPQIGAAPSIDAIALNFENNTIDVNIVHSGTTGKIQGTDNFLKTLININAPLYEVNQDPRQITVAKKGGDFSSIKSAVDYLILSGNTSATNRFIITVGPGEFTEGEIDLTSTPYVSIVGSNIQTTLIKPSGVTQHIINIGINNEISFLTLSGAPSGYAAINCDDIGDFGQCHKISFIDCDTNIWVRSSTQDTQFYGEYVDFNGEYSYGVRVEATNGFNAYCNVENYYQFPTSTGNTYANYINGIGAFLNCSTATMEGVLGSGSTAFYIQDGGLLNLSSVDINNWEYGIRNPNIGTGVTFEVVATIWSDCTNDISIENVSSIGKFQGIASHPKLFTVSPDIYWLFLDPQDGELDITRKGSVTFVDGTHTDFTTLLFEGSTMGLLDGGAITTISAFTINTATGYGYLESPTTPGIVKRIDWNDNQITLPSGSTSYIFINENGNLSSAGTAPDSEDVILLGRVVTDNVGVEFIDNSPVLAEHTSNKLSTFARTALGPVYSTGSIVTENGSNPFEIDVTQGVYFFAEVGIQPTGGTSIQFIQYFRNGLSGWTTSASTTISNTQYDNNGTLTGLTASAYTKHTLYVLGQGIYEKYFLVFGQDEYMTLVETEDAPLPTPPTYFTDAVAPIASIYVQQGTTGITQIQDIRPVIGFRAAGVNASSVHGNLLGLSADDHPQYLLADGLRAMSGNLDMDNNNIISAGTINGVTIQTHAVRHQYNGADAVGTLTPTAFAIPYADSSGLLDGWISDASTSVKGLTKLSSSPLVASDPIAVGTTDTGYNNSFTSSTYSSNVLTFTKVNGTTSTTSINSFTGLTINGNLTVTGSSALNGGISSTSLSGTTDRIVQVSSGGTFTATTNIISAYINPAGSVATLLDNVNNWDINGNYTGSTITGTFQGQKHYNNNYFFEAVADNLFIRLIRG